MGTANLGRVRGSMWYSGNIMTGTSSEGTVFEDSGIAQAFVWDKYLAENGNVYECVKAGPPDVAEWIYAGCIKGPMPEVENELDSTDTTKALSADAGRRINKKIEDSGILAKKIIIDSTENIYAVKVKIDNASTDIAITAQDNSAGKYQYAKEGTGKTVELIISIGGVIGLEAGSVLKSIKSSNTYIYRCDLYDADNQIVSSITPSIWNDVNILKENIEEAAVITETTEDGETASYRTGIISKLIGGLRNPLYMIAHAKSVWWNKLENRTMYDKVEEDCLQYANVVTDLDDMAAITEENAGKFVPDARAVAQLNSKLLKIKSLADYKGFTAATELIYTGYAITIPAKSYFAITATAVWGNARPTAIVLCKSSENNLTNIACSTDNHAHVSVAYNGYTDEEQTLYLWAKYVSAGTTEYVKTDGYYIQMANA